MSLLDVGKSCAECSTVDFLPFTCPLCSKVLCRAHVQAHACVDGNDARTSTSFPPVGPSSFRRKAHCEVPKCERPTIEAIGGKEGDELGEGIAREVRCRGCGGAYCTSHRAQTAHACSAPLEHNARHDAQEARSARAREIIAQKFPQYKDRVVPKPPPQRNVVKIRPRPPSPSPRSPSSPPNAKAEPEAPAPRKTKAEKLREVELRKIRSMAVPLEPRMRADGERRFFQWSAGSQDDLERWAQEGKFGEKKPDRVWVPQDTPLGKVLDLMIAKSKIPRPPADKPLELHCLYLDTERQRKTQRLQTDRPSSDIVEGGTVLLIRR